MEQATRIEPQPWMTAPETEAVMTALATGGGPEPVALFVGGCVRDTLLGRAVGDIDIATVLAPEQMSRRIAAAGIKVVPTGLAHGTVTAVVADRHFEITTLRVDVDTDGRRATVAFTDDWQADAERRDFTLNALYADRTGAIFDPVGGLDDLKAGRVRFVGNAEQRIREDVLRLLRFFRFYAQFGAPPPDAAALSACARLAHLLPSLSGERVAAETLKLLAAADPATTLSLMASNGVLAHFLPEARRIDRLAALVTVEGIVARADSLRRLAAMLDVDTAGADAIADRLRLSNADRRRLQALIDTRDWPDEEMTMTARRRALYRLGDALWRDRVLLAWAEEVAHGVAQERHGVDAWRALYELPREWAAPRLPLHGRDVLALGVPAGPAVGQCLEAVEDWWIAGDFTADRARCLAKLRDIVGARRHERGQR